MTGDGRRAPPARSRPAARASRSAKDSLLNHSAPSHSLTPRNVRTSPSASQPAARRAGLLTSDGCVSSRASRARRTSSSPRPARRSAAPRRNRSNVGRSIGRRRTAARTAGSSPSRSEVAARLSVGPSSGAPTSARSSSRRDSISSGSRPVPRSAATAAWIGARRSSDRASSSDGTPRPARLAASRDHGKLESVCAQRGQDFVHRGDGLRSITAAVVEEHDCAVLNAAEHARDDVVDTGT